MRTTAVNKMASMNGDQGAAPAAAGVSNALSVNRPSPASGLAAMRRIVLAGSPRLQDLNVLVCESEYVLAMDVSERVATMGATVVGRASTPEEAAALVRKHRADVDMAIVARHLGDRVAQSIVDRLETLGVPAIIYSDTPAGEQWTV